LDRYPFIEEGVRIASYPREKIGFWKIAQIDRANNVGHATVSVDGRTVRITATRIVKNLSQKDSLSDTDEDVYNDLEGEGSGLAFFWENPWEIKASIIRGVRSGVETIKEWTGSLLPASESVLEEREEQRWEVTSVIVDERPVVGSANSHPFFASQELPNREISPKSDSRTKYFFSFLAASASFIIVKRMYMNFRLWPAYVFARDYIQRHPLVSEFYNGDVTEVVARTGEFTRTRIEGEMTIAAQKMASESVIKFSASRKNASSPWLVSQALMTPSGCKPIDLLVSRPLM
jgi:hypothetical protein